MDKEQKGEVYSGTILKLGGKKSFGHRWQWRHCVIKEDCRLHYTDPKTNDYRGYISLEKAKVTAVSDDCVLSKLRKLKVPLPVKQCKEIKEFSYIQVKPNHSCKTYYFAVESSERENWLKYISFCLSGVKELQRKLSQINEMPTLLLHTDSPLTTPRVEFSNEVQLRGIDCDLSDTISGESSTSSFQFRSISFSESCSSKLSSYLDSPRSMNDDITNKSAHSGSMSSTSSTISYRSYQSFDTVNSDIINDSSVLHNDNQTQTETSKNSDDTKSHVWRVSRKCSQLNLQCFLSPHRKHTVIEKEDKTPFQNNNEESFPINESLNKSLDSLSLKDDELLTNG